MFRVFDKAGAAISPPLKTYSDAIDWASANFYTTLGGCFQWDLMVMGASGQYRHITEEDGFEYGA